MAELTDKKEIENLPKEAKNYKADEKKKPIEISDISISLETYDDIFSEFDPRDYSKKGLSEDFITEVKKASNAKHTGHLELKLLVPEDRINHAHEHVIRERLKNYFLHHANHLEAEAKASFRKGMKFVISGLILMMVATLLKFYYGQGNLTMDFFIILLEPGGWFLFWEGLTLVVFESKKLDPEIDFHRKLLKSEIEFIPY